MKKNIYAAFIILSILGFLLSVYLTIEHYVKGKAPCDINQTVSCTLVNTSIYSEILGIPVAFFGIVYFLALLLLSRKSYKEKTTKRAKHLMYFNISGLLFVVYLIIAEILLNAICPACTLVHLIVLSALGLSIYAYKKVELNDHVPESPKE